MFSPQVFFKFMIAPHALHIKRSVTEFGAGLATTLLFKLHLEQGAAMKAGFCGID